MPVAAQYDLKMPRRGTASSVPGTHPAATREVPQPLPGSQAALASFSRLSSFTPVLTRWPCDLIKHVCSLPWAPPLCARCRAVLSTMPHCLRGQSPEAPQRSLAWYPPCHEGRKSARLQSQPQSPACRRAQGPGVTHVLSTLSTHLIPCRCQACPC